MRSPKTSFPLPFTCQHEHYAAQVDGDGDPVVDDWGNAIIGWDNPVPVKCIWWPQDSQREFGDESVSNEQASVDLNLAVDSAVAVDQRDRFIILGRPFEVVGLPKEWDHGPFGFAPGRQIIELRWVG